MTTPVVVVAVQVPRLMGAIAVHRRNLALYASPHSRRRHQTCTACSYLPENNKETKILQIRLISIIFNK